MQIEKIDLSEERKLITYMIVSKRFLTEIAPIIKIQHLESPYTKIVGNWILEYYHRYKDCPGKNIQEIYNQKKNTLRDEDDNELIKEFLLRLSRDWEELSEIQNTEFLISNAIKYLKLQSLKYLKNQLEESIISIDPVIGEQAVSNFYRVTRPAGEGVSLFKDQNKISQSFMDTEEKLFRFKGVLGNVTGDFLRGDLIAFLSGSGKGKTWWQLYLAQYAALHRLKAVFFSLEMTQNQIVRRAWQGIVGATRENTYINLPYFEQINDKYKIQHKKVKKSSVNTNEIKQVQDRLKMYVKTGDVRIMVLPHYSATVNDIEAHIDNMIYYDNYIPDVIVVDYADIVASDMKAEYRIKLDDIWKSLRKIAQERNVLMATASQVNRKGLKSANASEADINEHIGKFHHVSKMFVLNQTEDEYEKGIMRLKQIKERDGKRSFKEVIVLQCLDIGRPYLDSIMKKDLLI